MKKCKGDQNLNRHDKLLIIVILEVAILIGIWTAWLYGAAR